MLIESQALENAVYLENIFVRGSGKFKRQELFVF